MNNKTTSIKFLASAIALTAALTTQTANAGLIDFSAKAGLGMSFPSASEEGEASYGGVSGMGFAGGVGIDVGLGPVSVIADALFTIRKIGAGMDSDNYSLATTNNILLPVQVKLSIMPLLFVTGGVYWNYLIGNVSFKDIDEGETGQANSMSASAAGVKKSTFGGVLGVGTSIPLGVTSLLGEARFSYGLTNEFTMSTRKFRHMGVDLLVGVTF